MNRKQSISIRLAQAISLLATIILVNACSVHVSGQAKSSADASANGKSEARKKSSSSAKAKATAKANASASAKSSAKSSTKKNVKVVHNVKFNFKSKGRAKKIKRTKKKDNFKATFLVHGGKAKAEASGKLSANGKASTGGSSSKSSTNSSSTKISASGSESANLSASSKASASAKVSGSAAGSASASKPKKAAKKEPKKTAKKGSKKTAKKGSKKTAKKGSKKTAKKDSKTEAPVEEEVAEEAVEVIEPPEAPSENVFGYEDPVHGCFEGIVYPLAESTSALPDFSALEGISVLYACEWDIPVTKYEMGFPGVEDRFEWFGIRYSGSFAVEEAGEWSFRISSDDGAKLYIDGKLVLDNDGVHAPKEKTITVNLEAGDHDMVLEYFQGPRYLINLQLFATPPGGEEGIFSVR